MSRKLCVLSMLAAMVVANVSAAGDAKTYRWVDAKGRVHYSDVPAPDAERVQIRPGNGVVGVPKEEASTASRAQSQQNCDRQKEQLATYQAATTITETDGLGNQKTYSAAEREQLLARLRDQTALACAGES